MNDRFAESARARAAAQARAGRFPAHEFRRLNLLTDVTGRHCSLDKVRTKAVSCCAAGHPDGGRVHRSGAAFVLASETVARFGFSRPEDLVRWLSACDTGEGFEYVPLGELTSPAAAAKKGPRRSGPSEG